MLKSGSMLQDLTNLRAVDSMTKHSKSFSGKAPKKYTPKPPSNYKPSTKFKQYAAVDK